MNADTDPGGKLNADPDPQPCTMTELFYLSRLSLSASNSMSLTPFSSIALSIMVRIRLIWVTVRAEHCSRLHVKYE